MLGALSIVWLWTKYGIYSKVIVASLMLWMFLSSISYGHDSLAYFNELGSSPTEPPALLGSIDWGQDLDKLEDTLRARRITSYSMRYFGIADPAKHGMSGFTGLSQPVEWAAISKFNLYSNDFYAWLRDETPTARIGNTILLYHFSEADIARLRAEIHGRRVAPANNTTTPRLRLGIN